MSFPYGGMAYASCPRQGRFFGGKNSQLVCVTIYSRRVRVIFEISLAEAKGISLAEAKGAGTCYFQNSDSQLSYI